MGFYSNWTVFWVLIAVALLITGTARDEWTAGSRPKGDLVYTPQMAPAANTSAVPNSVLVRPHKEFGTLNYRESGASGYGYQGICPSSNRRDDMNEISAGMMATIFIAGFAGFFATFSAFLAASNSNYVTTLKPAKTWSLVAFVFALVTFCVWLRAQTKFLDKGDNATGDCRVRGFVGGRDNAPIDNADRELAASFGLMVIGAFFYLVLAAWCNKMIKTHGENAPAESRVVTLIVAVLAFICVVAAAQHNVWSRASSGGSEDKVEAYLENLFGSDSNGEPLRGNVRVDAESQYGIYAARMYEVYSFPYNDVQNREYICRDPDQAKDDTGLFIVFAGRVTLGFACVACLAGLATLVMISKQNTAGFWLLVWTFIFALIAVVVWVVGADPAIRQSCCAAPTCSSGASVGLFGAALAAMAVAIYHQAYVMLNDTYVFHPPQDTFKEE